MTKGWFVLTETGRRGCAGSSGSPVVKEMPLETSSVSMQPRGTWMFHVLLLLVVELTVRSCPGADHPARCLLPAPPPGWFPAAARWGGQHARLRDRGPARLAREGQADALSRAEVQGPSSIQQSVRCHLLTGRGGTAVSTL